MSDAQWLDEFAKAALTYVGTLHIEAAKHGLTIEGPEWTAEQIAVMCYDVATEMVKESARRQQGRPEPLP